MSDASPDTTAYQFDCPLCDGSFEVDSQWLGQTIPCPQCDGDVMLPSLDELGEQPASSGDASGGGLGVGGLSGGGPSIGSPSIGSQGGSAATVQPRPGEPSATASQANEQADEQAAEPATASVTGPADTPADAAAIEPPRRLTPAERAAARRKFNLVLAISGGVLLLIVFAILSRFG